MKKNLTSRSRFALHNFAGKPTAWYGVEAVDFGSTPPAQARQPTHHIIDVDRSGSMYYDIAELRSTLEKVLTLDEFNQPDLRVSLISTSSTGDLTLHFAKVTVADVMRAGSPYLQAIRNLQATGATCLSQGLALAETLIDDTETTCITFHSDGFANDRSPADEKRALQAVVEKIKRHPKVFVNTIAYRDGCDFALLSSVSNQLSGTCIQAKGAKQVYESLHASTQVLAGKMAPVLEIPSGDAAYTVFVSRSAKKILGHNTTMTVQGLAESDDKAAYRLYKMTEGDFNRSKLPISELTPMLAYARAMISEGSLNQAKYAAVSTRIGPLIEKHARALTASEIAAFASDLEEYVVSDVGLYGVTTQYGFAQNGPSVLEVLGALSKYPGSVTVDLDAMMANYKRRGVKMLTGSRAADGTVISPKYDAKARDATGWVRVLRFDFNNSDATVNMLTSRAADLIEADTKKVVPSVAGVVLDKLTLYRNYTIVGDGVLNTPTLSVRLSDKRTHRALADLGVATGAFSHEASIELNLGAMPVLKYDFDPEVASRKSVDDFLKLTVLSKILGGLGKEKSGQEKFSAEQIAELAKHYITPNLYFSPPSCTPYTDLKDAINKGQVDTRLTYKVTIGTAAILHAKDLFSGNEFLQRRFTLEGNPKPTLGALLDPALKSKWGLKDTKKMKLSKVDELSFEIYASFVGLGSKAVIDDLLAFAGMLKAERSTFWDAMHLLPDVSPDPIEEAKKACDAVDAAIEKLYAESIRPLVFYIGATGLVPDAIPAVMVNADQLTERFPDLSPGKSERDGTFFVLPGDVVIGVFTEQAYFSTTAPAVAT